MSLKKQLLTGFIFLLAFAPALLATNVFVMSAGGASQQVNVFRGDPFAFTGSFLGSNAAFATYANPAGTRYYSVARSGTDTLVIVDQSFTNVLRRVNLADNGQAGAVTPDGRRMLVVAGALRIFDTATDFEISPPTAPDVGVTPIDVAVSIDSRYAFVLSSNSQRLTRVDLTTNMVAGPTLTIPGTSTGVTAAPNGLIYVSATNQIIVVDPATMTIRGQIALNARPGKMAVTPDGRYGVVVNQTVVTGSTVVLLDLLNRSVTGTISNLFSGIQYITMKDVIVVSNSRAFLTSADTQTLYELSIVPLNIFPVTVTGVGSPAGVLAAAASNEMPSARYLYYATANALFRMDTSSYAASQITIPGTAGAVSYAGPAATGSPASFMLYNETQTIAPGDTFRPLVVRALDASGRPLFNVPVNFSTAAAGVAIAPSTAMTNSDGLAMARVEPGSYLGSFTVSASIGAAYTASFALNVTTGVGPGGVGGVSVVSGQGQLVMENFLSQEPLTVAVRDASGNPVYGAYVTWSLTQGSGTVLSTDTITDINGQASTYFLASIVPFGMGFSAATVTATSGAGSVNFIVTSVRADSPPSIQLLRPSLDDRRIAGQAGQTITGAVAAQVVSLLGTPIPNVGLRVTTGLDPTAFPSASCVGGTVLTDASGIATCDLVLGGRTGQVELIANVGAAVNFGGIQLRVDPGPPGRVTKRQGDNQTGDAGQQLPLALAAEITDTFGNLLPGTPAQWEVVTPGSVTLRNVISVSDSNARVSALITLGSTPGQFQVRVRAGAASATFSVTVKVNVTQLLKISGEPQTAVVNQPFAQPLVVQLNDAQGRGVQGVTVAFAVTSGSASLSSANPSSDSQGRATVSVTAGGSAGPIIITASFSGLPSVTFSLSSRLPGPSLSLAGFTNGAGGQRGIVPGSVLNITAPGLAPGIQNCVVARTIVGGLPLQLANVTVQFGPDHAALYAPIFYVCNVGGVESMAVQAPFELAPGVTSVTIRVSGGSSTINNVPVVSLQPGIFETVASTGLRQGVATRPDGSYVTPQNPARRGETICLFATGLGAITPSSATNHAGVGGQNVLAQLVVGVNNAGVRVVKGEYGVGMIGVYAVYFEVPSDAVTGADRPLALAVVGADGTLVFGNGSSIPVQ